MSQENVEIVRGLLSGASDMDKDELLAALPQLPALDGPVILVVTGRNIDDDVLERTRTDPESFRA